MAFLRRICALAVRRPFRRYCTVPEDANEKIVREISAGDDQIEKKLRILMLEVDVMRQDGRRAPQESYMKKKHWETLLLQPSSSARSKYLGFLFKNNMSEQSKKAKKAAARELFDAKSAEMTESKRCIDEDSIVYNLSNNSMFLRIYERSINHFYNQRLLQTMMFGQKLVFDCSYDDYMTHREAVNAANQLTHFFASNRIHKTPLDVHLCNCNMNSTFVKQMYINIPSLESPEFPLTLHTESYLDHFPKEKLVYLTPHCRTDLVYDSDDIYIIGCMVDKAQSQHYSLAKAKENKMRMARLPLDRYLQWTSGSGKSLTINQVGDIILDMGLTNDWNYALKHVPRRKLHSEETTYSTPKQNIVNKFFYRNSITAPKNSGNTYSIKSIVNKQKYSNINKYKSQGLRDNDV